MLKCSDNNIEITRGDTGVIEVKLKNDAIFNIGDIVIFTVKYSSYLKEKLIEKKIPIKDKGNKIHIVLNPSDTCNLDFGNYVFDIELTTVSGIVNTIVKTSIFTILSEVTDNSDNHDKYNNLENENDNIIEIQAELNNGIVNEGVSLDEVFDAIYGKDGIKTTKVNNQQKKLEISGEELMIDDISNLEILEMFQKN